MNKREFKKAITAVGNNISLQMYIIGNSEEGNNADIINECIQTILNAEFTAKQNANSHFDKKEKDFDNRREYRLHKTAYYTKLFEKLSTDFGALMDEALKKFNTAVKPSKA